MTPPPIPLQYAQTTDYWQRASRKIGWAKQISYWAIPLLLLVPFFAGFLPEPWTLVVPVVFLSLPPFLSLAWLARIRRGLRARNFATNDGFWESGRGANWVFVVLAIASSGLLIPARLQELHEAQIAVQGVQAGLRMRKLMEIFETATSSELPDSLVQIIKAHPEALPLLCPDPQVQNEISAAIARGDSDTELEKRIEQASDFIYDGQGVRWSWSNPQVIVLMSKTDFGFRVFAWNNGGTEETRTGDPGDTNPPLSEVLAKDAAQRKLLGLGHPIQDQLPPAR
jgi:hypothetical protein